MRLRSIVTAGTDGLRQAARLWSALSRRHAEISPKSADFAERPAAVGLLAIGQTRVDLDTGEVNTGTGATTTLRPKTAAMLRVLAARPGELLAKDELLALVWPGAFVDEDGLVQCIGEIRRALGDQDRTILRTHAKRGYSFHPPEQVPSGATPAGVPRRLPRPAALGFLVLLLVAAAMAAYETVRAPDHALRAAAGKQAEEPVLAVFPFDSLEAGERWQRLARALTEDVSADLAQNSWLFVLADATTRSRSPASPAAAAALGADYFVTGSLQAEGNLLRISAAMADARTGRQLWSKRVEGPIDDFLILQRAASEALVGELSAGWNGPIVRAERLKARARGVDDLDAYELYLLAIERKHSYRQEDLGAASAMLKHVVAMQPDFGEAWAQISLTAYNLVAPDMAPAEMERLWLEGREAALQAHRVAPDDPHALAQAANVVRWDNPAEAERMVRRAAALAPNNADMLAYLSYRVSHFPALAAEAEGWIERAFRLNPDHPAWYDWNRGAVLMVTGRYGDAAEAFARSPDHVDARAGRVAALALAGDVPAARAAMALLLDEASAFTIDWHGEAAGLAPSVAEIYARGLRLAGAPEKAQQHSVTR